jgi:uroporphyrin-III C-methyltransferase/precorrin-2 dehydrogenase/sirohydrochlorin ferrochelatase
VPGDELELKLHPVFLKLAGRPVLVVGGGSVAERKIEALLEAGARVHAVAPSATKAIQRNAQRGALQWSARPFASADVDGVWLVVAATADPDVQQHVAAAAEERRTFVIAVDDPAHASAYSGAIVRRPPFTIAISSSGTAPALTRLVRHVIEEVLPSDDAISHARKLRTEWLARGTPPGQRFDDLVRSLARR